jgi:hypothetical protein
MTGNGHANYGGFFLVGGGPVGIEKRHKNTKDIEESDNSRRHGAAIHVRDRSNE